MFIGELCALLAAGLWAGTSLLNTYAVRHVGSFYANLARMTLSLPFFLTAILALRLPLALTRHHIAYLVLSSLVGIVIGDTFLFQAFRLIGARLSMLMMAISPAIAALLAYLVRGETLSAWGMMGMFVTIAGIAVVILERTAGATHSSRPSCVGVICGLFAAIGQGGGMTLTKLAVADSSINGLVAAGVRMTAAVMMLLPFALWHLKRQPLLPAIRQNNKILAASLGSGLFGAFLGITLLMFSVTYAANVAVASTLSSTSPVLMLPIVRVVYHERLSWRAMLGACVAVGGVAMLTLL